MPIMIRFYELEDVAALVKAALESVMEVQPWLPWCHAEITVEEAGEWVASQSRARQEGLAYEFVIVDEQGRYLGACGLNQIDKENRRANLGYWVRTSAAGQGVAPKAVGLLAEWAFENTNLERLEIVCAEGNTRSQRVAEKAGAQREGVLRSRLYLHGVAHDAVVYSLVRLTSEQPCDDVS